MNAPATAYLLQPEIKIADIQKACELTDDWLQRQDNRRKGIYTHIQTGIKSIDDEFEAMLEIGDLIVIAARPSMGKTAFAQQIVENISEKNDKSVLFVSAEMSKASLVQRSVMRRSGVSSHLLLHPHKQDDKDALAIAVAAGDFNGLNLYIDTSSVLEDVVERARALHAALKGSGCPLKVIVVDYLQYLSLRDSINNLNENYVVGKISRALSLLGKELGVAVVALSQLSRNCESRPNKRPVQSDIRQSGNIEQDADTILTLYRDEYYNHDSPEKGIVEVGCVKARNGSLGIVKLRWIPARLLFTEENNPVPDVTPTATLAPIKPAQKAAPAPASSSTNPTEYAGKAHGDDYVWR